MGIKRIEKIRNEKIRANADQVPQTREGRPRWLGQCRQTDEDVEMRTCKMEASGNREMGRPKLRRSDVINNNGGERSKDRGSTRPENVEIENCADPK